MKRKMLKAVSLVLAFTILMGVMMAAAADVNVTKISFSTKDITVEEDSKVTLPVSITPSDVKASQLKWTSSNTKVLTVSAGVVSTLNEGKATVTATSANGKVSQTCEVTVLKKGSTVEIKIPVYERGNQGQAQADKSFWSKWIADKALKDINVKVTYVSIPRTTDVDKFNILLAAGDAPDIIFSYDYSTSATFYGRGAFQEIPQYLIDTYASNYQKTVSKKTMAYGKVLGKQYYMTAKRPTVYNFVSLVRQDWLDKVKLKQPTTREEYYKVLKAFKEKDPGGLGANNVIPAGWNLAAATNKNGNYLERTNIKYDEKTHAVYSDISVGALSWEPDKDRLKFANRLYNEGLISPEFMLDRTGQTLNADFMNGKVGYYGMYMSANPPILQTLVKNVPTAKLSVVNPYSYSKGKKPFGRADNPFGMMSAINKNTSKQGVIAVLKFLNWMSQSENLSTLQYGIEGKNYTKVNGEMKNNTAYAGDERLLNGTNKDYWCLVTEAIDLGSNLKNMQADNKLRSPYGFDYLMNQNYVATKKVKLVTDFLFDAPITSLAKNSKTLAQKYEEATVKLIICKPSEFESLYKTLSEDYLASGYKEILDEKTSVYNKMKSDK